MSKLFNRAKMTTATTGTGNLTLGSAASGFVTFATAGVLNGDVVRYCIEAENGTDFEIGEGTYTASGTVLSRADADVQLSSNSNNRITLASGTHNVFITAADSDFTQEIIVTVANAGAGNKYVIDGTSQQIITLLPSITYRLDQSDSSNASHPLVLASGSADGSTYSTGVRTVGTPGSSGSYTEVKLEQDAPALFYKCSNHSGMGSSVNLGAPSGGVTSVANQSAMLALSSPSVGDMVYRQDNYKLMMYNGSGWYAIATINTSPTVSSVSQTTDGSTSAIAADGTFAMTVGQNTVVTITGADAEEGTTLTYAATVTSGTQSDVLASLSQSSNVFTLAPASSGTGGTITIRFDVSDSAAVGNQSASFSVIFGITNSRFTSLLLHASAAGTNQTFTDGSSTGHTITASGDPLQGAFSPYRASALSQNVDLDEYAPSTHGGSISLDANDYLSVADHSDFDLSSTFTVEGWFYLDSMPAGGADAANAAYLLNRWQANNNNRSFLLGAASDGSLFLRISTNGSASTLTNSAASLITANAWFHVSLVYQSNVYKVYLNGTERISYSSSSVPADVTAPLMIGYIVSGSGGALDDFSGKISDVRIVDGTAIVPPSGGPTSPLTAVTNTKLLVTGREAKVFDKSQNSNLTLAGHTTGHATTKFSNEFSVYFDGTEDYVLAPASSNLNVAAVDVTLEGYFYTTSTSVKQCLWEFYGDDSNYVRLFFEGGNGNVLRLTAYSGGASRLNATGSTTLAANQWYHIAVTRVNSSGAWVTYINGTADSGASGTESAAVTTTTWPFEIGRDQVSTDRYWSGYIQDFRFRKRLEYTGNFTPPTAALQG